MAEKKSGKAKPPAKPAAKPPAKKVRVYEKYAKDPVFLGLIVLVVLIGIIALYYALMPAAPKPVTPIVVPVNETPAGNGTSGNGTAAASPAKTFDVSTVPGICTESGKPLIMLFTTSWCPHCKWAGPAFDEVAKEYVNKGKIVAHHWQIDTDASLKDDLLTPDKETAVPDSAMAYFNAFNSRGSIPTFVFGCKYYRIGTGYERENDLEAEKAEFRALIDDLIAKVDSEPEYVIPSAEPTPAPEAGPSVGSFDSKAGSSVCAEGKKPKIYLFSTTWCPHCQWAGPDFDAVAKEYVTAGKIVAYHWQVDTGDNTLTDAVESTVPESDKAIYQEFNPGGSIPTFVMGCKYYRIGAGYERANDHAAEQRDLRAVIDALINETAA